MSLRVKTFLLLLVIFGLYAVVDNYVQRRQLLPTFARLERDEAYSDMQRCVRTVGREVGVFGDAIYSWSSSERIAPLLRQHDPAVLSKHLTLADYVASNANLIMFASPGGYVVWSKALDLQNGKTLDIPDFASGKVLENSPLLSTASRRGTTAGVMSTSAGPMMVAAQRVLDSQGRPAGTVVMGRQIDEQLVNVLEQQSGVNFEIQAISSNLPPDDREAFDALATGEILYIRVLDSGDLQAYSVFPGLTGQPALLFSAERPRAISSQGEAAVHFAQGSLLALALFVLLTMALLLEKLVLSRLGQIGGFCRKVQRTHDLSQRIEVAGHDELNRLAQDINVMVVELELMNRQLDEALAESQAAAKAKSEFLAVMSHEIRTPMNGVLGMLGVLANTQLTAEQYDHLEVAQESAENLLRLLNDILDFSKIEAGKLEIEEIDFNLPMLIEDNLRVIALKSREKGLELITDIDPAIPMSLVGDPGRVRQILSNLLSNAVKFTHSGYVAVTAQVEHEDEDLVGVRISVQDSGIGIPADRIDRLFRSFSQVDASTTRQYGGTGLGLAICSTLAEMMGGQVGVQSESGRGSIFWFSIPFCRHAAPEKSKPLPLSELRGHSVLIVDDSPINRRVMNLQLAKWGLLVAEAESGRQALEMLRAAASAGQPYEVCILDYIMPGLNGQELGQAILSDPLISDSRLVLVTSAGQRGDATKFHALGYAAYLSKPITQNQLVECIAAVLGQASPARPQLVTKYTLAESQTSSLNILLAEDNRVNQKVAVALLSRAGHKVEIAEDGRAVIEAVKRGDFDVVLMDCHMPEIDGFQATSMIRRLPGSQADVPIIAMTARVMESDRDACLNSGMDDYLSKPINPVELMSVLERTTELRAERSLKRELKETNRKPELSVLAPMGPQNAGSSAYGANSNELTGRIGYDNNDPETNWNGSVNLHSGPMDISESIARAGDRGFWLELVDIFMQECPQRLAALDRWLERCNYLEAEHVAHSIKGSCAEMLAEPMRMTAQALETCLHEGNTADAAELVSHLKERFRELTEILQQEQAMVA